MYLIVLPPVRLINGKVPFSSPPKFLCAPRSQLIALPQILATMDLFSISSFAFKEYHLSGMVYYVVF